MYEKYEPTQEEMGAAEGWMDDFQRMMTEDRENAYNELSEEEKQRLPECDLKYSNGTDLNASIEGTIKGRQVSIRMTNKAKSGEKSGNVAMIEIDGSVNGMPITPKQAFELYVKYRNIAKFQSAVDSQHSNQSKYESKAAEMQTEDVVKDLLA